MDFINNFDLEIRDLNVKNDALVGELDNAWYNAVESFNMDRVATCGIAHRNGKTCCQHRIGICEEEGCIRETNWI